MENTKFFELIAGVVGKFNLTNDPFEQPRVLGMYPKMKMSIPSGQTAVFTLGIPSVVWWKGVDRWNEGCGLAIRESAGEWAVFTATSKNHGHDFKLVVGYEQLAKLGIRDVFQVRVGLSLPDGCIQVDTIRTGAGSANMLAVEPARLLDSQEIEGIRQLLL
jgi:hypothetical protein